MEDLTFGLAPNNDTLVDNPVVPSFSPGIVTPSLSAMRENNFPTFDLGSYIDDASSKLAASKPSLQTRMANNVVDPNVVNSNRYKNADSFNTFGLDLSGQNNEELYGTYQTRWSKFTNAIVGGDKLAGHQFWDQATSWDDTFDLITNNPVFKQQELQEISDRQKRLQDENPIFQTKQDTETFWNTSNFANMLQQSGYAVGAIEEMAAEEAALTWLTGVTFGTAGELQVARTIERLNSVKKALTRSKELNNAFQEASTMRKIFNNSFVKFLNPLENATEVFSTLKASRRIDELTYGATKGLARTTGRVFGGFYRDVRMVNAAIAEGKAEAATTYTDLVKYYTDNYVKQNGKDPSPSDLNDIQSKAYEAAQTNGAANIAMIMWTDKIAFDGVLKKFKPTRFLEDALTSKGLFLNSADAIKKGEDWMVAKTGFQAFTHQLKTAPLTTLTKEALNYTKSNLMEGVQEVMQNMSNDAVQTWYKHKYGSPEDRARATTVYSSMVDSAKSQWNMEGAKTFFSGFLTGALMNMGGKAIGAAQDYKEKLFNNKVYQAKKDEETKSRDELVKSMNTFYKDPISFITLFPKLSEAMEDSAKAGNKKMFFDFKDDNARHFILTSIRNGTIDSIKDRFEDYAKNLTTEEFKQAFPTSIVNGLDEDKSKHNINELLLDFNRKVDNIKELSENLDNLYPNPHDIRNLKNATPEQISETLIKHKAHEDAIQSMIFSGDAYKEIGKRQEGILTDIKKINPDISFGLIYSMASKTGLTREIETLNKEVEALDDSSIKTEKLEKLEKLKNYDKALIEYNEQTSKIVDTKEIRDQFIKEHGSTILDIMNTEAVDKNVNKIKVDDFNQIVHSLLDYHELAADKQDVLEYYNLVANPQNFASIIQAHVDMWNKMSQTPPEEKSITVMDDDGNERTVTKGDRYITNKGITKRVYKNKLIDTFDQDYIKIIDISGDNIIVSINNSETVTYSKEEFAKELPNLIHFDKLSINEKMYYAYRNKKATLKVNKFNGLPHLITGKHLNKDYSNTSVEVSARVVLEKREGDEEPEVYWVYINPKTKQNQYFKFNSEYNNKYLLGSKDLEENPTWEEDYKRQLIEKRKANLIKQIETFEAYIKENENKLANRIIKNSEIEKTIKESKKQLEDLQKELNSGLSLLEDSAHKKGRKSKIIVEIKEKVESIQKTINNLEIKVDSLNKERENLQKDIDELNKARELYYEALDELNSTNEPYDRNGRKNIYDEEQDSLDRMVEDSFSERFGIKDVDGLIKTIEEEKSSLLDRVNVLKDIINNLNKLLSTFVKYKDILNVINESSLNTIKDSKKLQTELYKLKLKEKDSENPDTEKIEIINSFLSALGKNKNKEKDNYLKILNTIILTKELLNAQKEFKDSLERLAQLQDKLDLAIMAKEQNEKINISRDRVDFLRQVQDLLLKAYEVIKAQAGATATVTPTKIVANTIKEAKELSEYTDIMNSEPIVPGDPEKIEDINLADVDKPNIENPNVFLKSQGRHFLTDSRINEAQARLFRFNETVNLDDLFYMVITENNNPYNISLPKEYVDGFSGNTVELKEPIVKLLAVRKVDGDYLPVGMNGETLKAEELSENNMIISDMVNPETNGFFELARILETGTPEEKKAAFLDYKNNGKNPDGSNAQFSLPKGEEITDEVLVTMIKERANVYIKFRESLLANPANNPIYYPVEAKSAPIQRKVPKIDGKTQELALEGTILPEDPTWKTLKDNLGNDIGLTVVTAGRNNIRKGRIAMVRKIGRGLFQFIQVYNRKVNEQEKSKILNCLKYLSTLYGRKTLTQEKVDKLKAEGVEISVLNEDEKTNFDLAIKYLINILNWKQPVNGKAVSNNQMFLRKGSLCIIKETEKDKFEEFSIDFNPDSLDKLIKYNLGDNSGLSPEELNLFSKFNIGEFYHNVNSNTLKKRDADFTEVNFNEDGIETTNWSNYEEYLLSGKDNRQAPIYTNIVPFTPLNEKDAELNPQFKNNYLTFKISSDEGGRIQADTVVKNEVSTVENSLNYNNIPINKELAIKVHSGNTFVVTFDGKKFKINKIYRSNGDLSPATYDVVIKTQQENLLNLLYTKFTLNDKKEFLEDYPQISLSTYVEPKQSDNTTTNGIETKTGTTSGASKSSVENKSTVDNENIPPPIVAEPIINTPTVSKPDSNEEPIGNLTLSDINNLFGDPNIINNRLPIFDRLIKELVDNKVITKKC